jgi:uncharacterized membrane protein
VTEPQDNHVVADREARLRLMLSDALGTGRGGGALAHAALRQVQANEQQEKQARRVLHTVGILAAALGLIVLALTQLGGWHLLDGLAFLPKLLMVLGMLVEVVTVWRDRARRRVERGAARRDRRRSS